jgi:hypothetical protein
MRNRGAAGVKGTVVGVGGGCGGRHGACAACLRRRLLPRRSVPASCVLCAAHSLCAAHDLRGARRR